MFDDFDDDIRAADEAAAVHETESLLPPREMQDCLGHEGVEALLLEQIKSDRLPHALIFSGPQGIGKSTMAFRLAGYLLKTGKGGQDTADGGLFGDALPKEESAANNLFVAPEEPAFRQVASGGHADLITIERQFDEKKNRYKAGVAVDDARRIVPFMRMTASQGGWKIAIIDDADTMNRNAQNAILKILEEPPEHALLILVCHRIGAMIPTIRSRCRTIPFTPLGQSDFGTLLARHDAGLPQEDVDILYNISGGSIGQGLRILEEDGLGAIEKIMALLYSWPQWQWSEIHKLADSLNKAGQEQSLQAFQEVLLWVVESLLRAKAKGQSLHAPLNNDVTQKLLDHYSLTDWIEIYSQLKEHFDTVSIGNLDKRHAVLGAFSLFKEAA